MDGYTSTRKQTGKARRKDNSARVTAQGLATLGNAKARRPQSGEPKASPAPARVIDDREPSPDYVVKEHTRRDTSSRIVVIDTMAFDVPDDAVAPFTAPDGTVMRYAVMCQTHGGVPQYFGRFAEAGKAAKSSPSWCAGCAQAQHGKAALISKQNPRAKRAPR